MDTAARLVLPLLMLMQPEQQKHLGPSVPVLDLVTAAAAEVLRLV
jgi:hypothetical protein